MKGVSATDAVREWTLVVPVKAAALGKSRLHVPGVEREALARAVAIDTVSAAAACARVIEVLVVTADEVTAGELREIGGARIVEDDADGLRAAITRGLAAVPDGVHRAVLLGDLPALRSAELSRALEIAEAWDRAFVPDADGGGTSLATARAGHPLPPLFGPASAAAHRDAGFVEMDLPESWGLRRDLDTAEHLPAVRRAGLGIRTAALLASAAPVRSSAHPSDPLPYEFRSPNPRFSDRNSYGSAVVDHEGGGGEGPRIVVLAGGVGGSKFVLGLRDAVRERWPDEVGGSTAHVTVIANTGDDLWLSGVRLQPDIDSMLYALAGVNDADRGWGRTGETERVAEELRAWGAGWPWFTLGDLDLGTHIARTGWLRDGATPSEVVARLSRRWPLGVRMLPMTDAEVDTHVVTDEGRMHFQEWWTRHRARLPARAFESPGVEHAAPAPGVLAAIAEADAILVAPSNPVVSIGRILAVPGIADAVRAAPGGVAGVSPIIAGSPVRGMADACLAAVGIPTAADAVGMHYGSRSNGGLLDAWLIAQEDAQLAPSLTAAGVPTQVRPLWMRDPATSARLAADALDAALGG